MKEGCDTKSYIVNTTSEFLPISLTTSNQSQNSRSSTYISHNNNNIYQGFIQTKIITILIIRMLSPSKYHQTVIKQKHATSPNVKKASDILLLPGDDDMGQYIRPINKSGKQEILIFG